MLINFAFLCSVCRRTVRNLSRDRMGVLMRLSQNLIYGLFVAFFVIHLDIDVTKGAVQDRIGIIYQSIGASPYTGMLNAVALCEFRQHQTSAHQDELVHLHLLVPNTRMLPDSFIYKKKRKLDKNFESVT